MARLRIGIVGATGYTGAELLRLLVGHADVELAVVTSRSGEGQPVAALFPWLRGHSQIQYCAPDSATLAKCDLVFFATPNGTAMHQAPALLKAGVRIVDLSADFRLRDPTAWKNWHGQEHACPELLARAVYGLPERNRDQIRKAELVANPGCYPTAISLGLLPFLKADVVDASGVIADAKSGVSGAGRKAEIGLLFSEAGESFKAYSASGHRHLPEIRQLLDEAAGHAVALTFVPHLVPMVRGIHATLYFRLKRKVDPHALLADFYSGEPFVDIMPAGAHPETRSVRGSNMCRIAIHQPQLSDQVVVLSVIDNLVKGGAGQAVQNMNLMFGLPEDRGLSTAALAP
ncbi:MAG: N-acetyl-gamma-glutamyl-phosphate reductase [Gammaproteobacteria bacterium]|nr:N-acetyl-gamma-glutamyl-phosphate reductase [Gammaproteobacteria bacterium]